MPAVVPRQEEARPPALGNGTRSNATSNSGKMTAHFPLKPFTNKTHNGNMKNYSAPKCTGPSIHLTPLDCWNDEENYPRKIQMTLDRHVAGDDDDSHVGDTIVVPKPEGFVRGVGV
jgi:hypothetical protein